MLKESGSIVGDETLIYTTLGLRESEVQSLLSCGTSWPKVGLQQRAQAIVGKWGLFATHCRLRPMEMFGLVRSDHG